MTSSSAGYRLSPQQRRLWELQAKWGERPFCSRALVYVRGELDAEILRAAMDDVATRYEILRTSFPCPPGMTLPVQRIGSAAAVAWQEPRDLTEIASSLREETLEAFVAKLAEAPFDFEQGPLLRVATARLATDEHALAIVLPALCADPATLANLARQVAFGYAARVGEDAVGGDASPFQYADLAEWQNELLESEETAAGREHWEAWDPAACRALRLPFEVSARRGDRFEPLSRTVPLDPGLVRRARELADAMRVSVSTLFLASWQSLLWRLLGQQEIVLGVLAECRSYEGLSESLGPLAAYVPLACRLDHELRFREVVIRADEALRAGAEWQEYFRWESVSERTGIPFEDTVFPASFAAREQTAPWRAGRLEWALPFCQGAVDRFRLELRVHLSDNLPAVELAWDGATISRGEAEALARAWRALLSSAVAEPERRLDELVLAAADERRHLSSLGASRALAAPTLVHEMFERQAQRVPDRPAVICEGVSLTYAELAERARQLAARLRRLGVGPDERVALCLERSLSLPVAILGALRAGGAYLPVEPGLPLERKSFLLADARPRVVLTETRFLSGLPAAGIPILCLDEPRDLALPAGPPLADGPPTDPANLVYVVYTSGSTGAPKGVAVEHRQLAHYVQGVAERLALPDGASYAMVSTFAADLGNTVLFPSLCGGGTLHLIPDRWSSDPIALATALESDPVDCMKITPSHLEALLAGSPSPHLLPQRCLVLGGEASRSAWVEHLLALRPQMRVINHYGPTETTVGVLTHPASAGLQSPTLPLGPPLPGTAVRLLGTDLEPVPAWFTGELYVGGASVARGYLERPDLTADRFVPDPWADSPGARMYRTGDLARRLPDRTIELLGRADDQVKIRGFRIELGEIEAVLESHPAVRRTAVAAREDSSGMRRLVAYVVTRAAGTASASDLRGHLQARLPEFMVPAAFVFLDSLPLNSNGKVVRRALPEPDWRHLGTSEALVPPATPTEELLAQVWSDVLGVDRVGALDNFFLLGGDSIRGLVVRARAEDRGVTFSVQQLFENPVLRDLARVASAEEAAPPVDERTEPFSLLTAADRTRLPLGLDDAYPLARLQAGMLFHSEAAAGTAIFHDLHSVQARGACVPELLCEAVRQASLLHPVLRTSFDLVRFSEPLQLVHAGVTAPCEVHDLRAVPEDEQERRVGEWLRDERQRPFDLSQPPLVAFHVHILEETKFQFTMSFHHAILDGWSSASLLTDLFRRYAALLRRESPLPIERPEVTYRDFVALERAALASERARSFWDRQLDGAEPIRLPRSGPSVEASPETGVRRIVPHVGVDLSESLQRAARNAGVPLKSALLAAYLKVLGVLGGATDVLTALIGHGRPEHVDGERVLGLFLNTLPLRVGLRAGSWSDLARDVFDAERRTFPFRRFPFAEIQRRVRRQLDLEVAFNFMHYHVYQDAAKIHELKIEGRHDYEETNFDLVTHVALDPGDSRIQITLLYRPWELDAADVERLADYLGRALQTLAADPAARHDMAVLLSPGEIAHILSIGEPAVGTVPPDIPLHGWFEQQAVRDPGAIALVWEDREMSYGTLDAAANRLARRLRRLGVGPEVRVGLCAARTPRLVTALLAVLKAGGAYVPLDPGYPRERLAFMLADSGASVLLTEEALRANLPAVTPPIVLLDADEDGLAPGETGGAGVAAMTSTESLAYLIYTSGSTGRPKGVAISHGAASSLVAWALSELPADERVGVLATTSICFDLSIFELFVPLSCGGTVLLVDDALALLRPSAAAVAARATLLNTVPSAAAELVRAGALPGGLRAVNLAGEPLPRTLVDQLHAAGVPRVYNLYGPSEDTTYSTVARIPAGELRPPSIGRPIQGGWVRLLDNWLQPVPPGVPGEIFLGGSGVARGYLGNPALTAASFLPDPWSRVPGARLYRTGDLARLPIDSGELEFLGRVDQQVKVRGFRIEPGEIESALLRQDGIREAFVAALPEPAGSLALVAWLAVEDADTEDWAGSFRARLREWLPEHMVPSRFVVVPTLPRTPNGKVDRSALSIPETGPTSETSYVPPGDPIEEALAGIWADVLRRDRVGIHDDFFALGGHSLLATQVISRARLILGTELSLRKLFDAPTVAGLAHAFREERTEQPTPPLVPLPRHEGTRPLELPLSFAQQRLWLIDQLEPGNPAYNIPFAGRLRGPLSVRALERVFCEVVRRHEALRTTFAARETGPVQRVAPPSEARPHLTLVDLTGLAIPLRDEEAGVLTRKEARQPFDLGGGPLLRVTLIRMGHEDHLLLLTVHHIVSDGWSMRVLLQEIATLLPAFSCGLPSPLPELPVQYADFSAWQRSWLQGEALAGQLGFWRRQLVGAPQALDLPTDRPRPGVQTFRGSVRPLTLPPAAASALCELCRREGVTPFMALLAAWSILLGRHARQDNVLVGSPIAGRSQREVEGLIGFFVNTLVLRSDLRGKPSFRELLQRVRGVALDAYAHQDLPFERIVEEVVSERDLSRSPLVQVLLVLHNMVAEAPPEVPGLSLTPVTVHGGLAKFDLTLSLGESADGISGGLEHNADLFDPTTAERLASRFTTLLTTASTEPSLRIDDLPLLLPSERHQIVTEWNDSGRLYHTDVCLHELIAGQAQCTPDAVAVAWESSELTYRELEERARGLARHLRRCGVLPGARVGALLERSGEMIVGLLGILKAGAAYVPLDPTWPAERISLLVESARTQVVLAQERFVSLLSGRREQVVTFDAGLFPLPAGHVESTVPADLLAYVLFTSGSTGAPKGVMIPHRGIVNRLLWMQKAYGLTQADRVLQKTPFSFDVSVWELFWPLLVGARLVFARPEGHKDPAYLADLIARQRITTLHFVPSMLRAFLDAPGLDAPLPSLRRVMASGEALPPDLVRRFFSRFPNVELHNLYGPTEASVDVSFWACTPDPAVVPIGRPIANLRLHVVNAELRPQPLGVPGELALGGIGLARGYAERPDLTAAAFVPDPLGSDPGDRLYRTGDLARQLPDGQVEYLGRIDHQVKVRGFRIEPGEIEATLLGHPQVRECAVVAWRDVLVAYVTIQPGGAGPESGEDLPATLPSFLSRTLPDFMVPALYVVLETLPLSPHGKVNRKALPAPDPASGIKEGGDPADLVEEILLGIWSEVLQQDRIGVDDDFFTLGGHSLSATQVISRLHAALGVELPLRRIFEAPTVAALARVVRSAPGAPPSTPIPRVTHRDEMPLSFAQQRLWVIDRLEPGNPAYNIPFVVRLAGELPAGLLEAVFEEVVRRHEILRSRFLAERPAQVVLPAGTMAFVLPQIDLTHLQEEARETAARWLARDEARQPFDLQRDLPLRVRLVRLTEHDHLLLVTLHHIVADGWSIGVLQREISALFPAFGAGRPSPLRELPLQYADFAAWQRGRLHGEALAEQVEIWKSRLAGAPQLLRLPTDRPRPALQSFRGAVLPLAIPPDLSDAVRGLCRREGVTPFITLLAAWAALLGRLADQDDFLIGAPIAGRNRREIEELIGFFVNTLVLRCDLLGNPTFRELQDRVRRTAFDAFTHSDLSFERIVEEIAVERSPAVPPLVQVLFSFQNAPRVDLDLPGLALSKVDIDPGLAKTDLTLALTENTTGFLGHLELSTDLFDASTAQRLLARFVHLLKGVAADPGLRPSDLSLLLPGEREQILAWSTEERRSPAGSCIHRLFERQALRTPEATALVAENRRLTYGELDAAANRLARHLHAAGVGAEMRVAILLERSPDWVVALLAVLKAGGAYVPLDPSYPAQRLATLATDSASSVLVTAGDLDKNLPSRPPRVVHLGREQAAIAARSGEVLSGNDEAAHLAYVIFTSGSTGRPKGVMVAHDGLCNLAQAQIDFFAVRPGDRVLQFASPGFDASVSEVWMALLGGAELHLAESGSLAPGLSLMGLLRGRGITHATLSPSVLAALPAGDLPDLRALIVAGEAFPPELARSWRRTSRQVFNAYGPTEGTVCATVARLGSEDAGLVSIGRPLAGARVLLLDRGLAPVPAGVPAEICLGGAGLARGYLGQPGLTAERFRPDPLSGSAGPPGGRLYHTGDLGRWLPDGSLDFLGRIDQQVKLRGIRIEPDEVRAALLTHPAIREAAVVPREEAGGLRLVAYVVAAEGDLPAAGELRAFLRQHLPDFMVPSAFVTLEALSLTSHGKLDRSALPAPDAGEREFSEPRTPDEEILAGLWAELLGLDQVGIHDDFFALGGHSLLAMQVMSRLREAFGVELPLLRLFEAPTVAGLARAAREAGPGTEVPPPLVPRGSGAEPVPLSFAQRRLWLLDQIDPGSAAYNIPLALGLAGELRPALLEQVFAEIMRRHEILRTTFHLHEEEPVQVIGAEASCRLPLLDLSALSATTREALSQALTREEARGAFDLGSGPLLRLRLLRLSRTDHLLLLTVHHIVADGWSLGVLMREVEALYDAFGQGAASPLAALPVQYADFAVWQRSWLQGRTLDSQLDAWKRRLAGAPRVLELPTDRPRPAVRSGRGATRSVALSPGLSHEIRALGRRHDATPFMVLLASWALLLGRLAGQEDVLIGAPIANRNRREVEDLIGFFVNTLVLRVDRTDAPTFDSLLARVRRMSLEAFTDQDLSFERIVDEMAPERDLALSPLFQAAFLLQNAPQRSLRLPGLALAPVAAETGLAKFDLTLALSDSPSGFAGSVEYSTDLFDGSTILRWLSSFDTLLRGIVADPTRELAELPWLSEAERVQLLAEWNGTPGSGGMPETVVDRFIAQVACSPEATALVWSPADGAAESYTYRELDCAANALAHRLAAAGVRAESRVALLADRSPEMVAGLLGILKAGGAYVPLDPDYPEDRLRLLLDDCEASVLVVPPHRLGQWTGLGATVPLPRFGDGQGCAAGPEHWPKAEDLAYMIYTSGTTGAPKAVMVEHGSLARTLHATREAFGFTSSDRMPCLAPFSFDIFLFELLSPLLVGGTSVLFDLRPVPDVDRLAAELSDATLLHSVPALMRQIVEAVERSRAPVDRLRGIFVGGDAVPPELLAALHRTFPSARTWVLYGPTESTIVCAHHAVGSEDHRTWIGRPFAGASLRLCDPQGRPVPIGVSGEIWVSGSGVSRGYWKRDRLTEEKFVLSDGERHFRTGDLARRLPDGSLVFVGRADHQVKVRGFRIEPGEVEAALLALPMVRECVVLAREDRQGDRRLAAYVVLRGVQDGPEPPEARLRAALARSLPEWMIPSFFIPLNALPLTPHGKVDRNALPSPAQTRPVDGATFAAPREAVEAALATIWAEVLGVDRVGRHDNFFTLGGDSILSIQVAARAQRAGLGVTSRLVFLHQTVAQLAEAVRDLRSEVAEPGPAYGPLPLTPIQRRFFAAAPADPNHFNQSVLLEEARRLEPSLLAAALAVICRHHGALGLRFRRDPSGWQQASTAPTGHEGPLAVVDLSTLPAAVRSSAIEGSAAAVQRSLDLAAGPLQRAVFFSCGSESPGRFLWVVHHLVVDAVSWRILLGDLAAVYADFEAGRPANLPARTASFGRWAKRLAEEAAGAATQAELRHWLATRSPEVPRLPRDFEASREANTLSSQRSAALRLDPDETQALLQEVPKAYHTRINDALLTALALAFQEWTGAPLLLVDLEGHGREDLFPDLDLTRTVGWFTSVYPVLLDLRGAQGVREALREVKELLRRVPRGGIGYGLLEGGAAAAQLAGRPQSEVSFNYLGQLDQVLSHGFPFRAARESAGRERPIRSLRPYLLEIQGGIFDGRLSLSCLYSERFHRPATIERLVLHLGSKLRELIHHCRAQEAGGFTPSDFPLAGLTQAQLDGILGRGRAR